MEDILKAVASGLKFDAEQFIADFKQGDDFMPEKEIAEKLATLISDKVKAANETAKKVGRSEVGKRFSRLIKDSGFENSENLEGEPLFSAFLEWKGEQGEHAEGDPKAMSRDELLKLPVVKSIVKEVEAKSGEKWSGERKEMEAKMSAAENTRKRLLLNKSLAEAAKKAKINLGETPEQEALRLSFLESKIELSRLNIGEKDALKYLDSDGFESDLDFEKEVLETARTAFGVVTQDKNRGGSGAQGSGSASGANGQYTPTYTFGSQDAFDKQFLSETDPVKRATMHKDRQIQQEKESSKAAG